MFCMRNRLLISLLLAGTAARISAQSVTLPQLRSLSLQNHPAAAEANALVQLGRAGIFRARTLEDPSLRFSFGNAEPREIGASGREHSWEISQEIPFFLSYRHRVRAARYAAQSFDADAQSRLLELLFRVEVLYITYAGAHERRSIAAESVSDAEKIFDLTSRRVELGEARETERIRSEVELLRARRSLADADRDAEVSREALRRTVGPGLPEQFSAEPLPAVPDPIPDLQVLQRRLEDRNPELQASRSDAARASEALRTAVWGAFPDLTASYYQSREIDKTGHGITLGFRLPLWNIRRPEVARSRADESLAKAAANRRAIELVNDLDRAYREFNLAADQVRTFLQRLLPASRESLRLSRLAYEEGETAFLELLDAQRTFRETAAESVAARREAAIALAEIRRLTGGESE